MRHTNLPSAEPGQRPGTPEAARWLARRREGVEHSAGSMTERQPIRKAVIPVAGKATRHRPASYAIPKGLFPLVDADGRTKPVVHFILEEAFASGLTQACLVVGPGEDGQYRRYFDALAASGEAAWASLAERVSFAEQREPLGYGHAVLCAREFAAGEPVLVMLGDHVYRTAERRRCTRQLLDCYESRGAAVSAVQRTPEVELRLFGTVAATPLPEETSQSRTSQRSCAHSRGADSIARTYRVHAIVEKPEISLARRQLRVPGLAAGEYLCWFGLHAMTNTIFDVLAEDVAMGRTERGEFQLTGAQARLLARQPYFAHEIAGQRYDMGDPPSLVATQAALARAMREEAITT